MKEQFSDVFDIWFDSKVENIHTIIPGKINNYNKSQRKASVEPLVKLKTIKEVDIEAPIIENVPVMFPSGSNFTLSWEIENGDGCLILFSEVSIGNYLNSAGNEQISAEDSSRFSFTDAICIPGLFSFQKVGQLSTDNSIYIDKQGKFEIKNANGTITLNTSGQVDINGNLTVDI